MDEPRGHKWNKPVTEEQVQVRDCTYMRYLRVKLKEAGISGTCQDLEEGGNELLYFNLYKVSVLQDKCVLEIWCTS